MHNARRLRNKIDQVDFAKVPATGARAGDGKVVEQEFDFQAGRGDVAKTDRAKRPAESRLEDVVVGVIVEASAEVLSGVGGKNAGGGVEVDRRQSRGRVRGQIDPNLTRGCVITDRHAAVTDTPSVLNSSMPLAPRALKNSSSAKGVK